MRTKEAAQDLRRECPEHTSRHEGAPQIEFVAGIRQGLEEIERGERISIEEIDGELPTWIVK